MKTLNDMRPERLNELVGRFSDLRIAVLGDFFLDKYLDVDPRLAEVSVETGKTAHQVVGIRHSPGAAGTVVCNLAALGTGTLHAIGFTGDDGQSYELRKDLAELRCSTDHLHCDQRRMTPTYLKPRDKTDPSLAGEHEVPVLPWGGGTALGVGSPPTRVGLVLGLKRLDRLLEHEPGDLTVTVEAGITLDAPQLSLDQRWHPCPSRGLPGSFPRQD